MGKDNDGKFYGDGKKLIKIWESVAECKCAVSCGLVVCWGILWGKLD